MCDSTLEIEQPPRKTLLRTNEARESRIRVALQNLEEKKFAHTLENKRE